MKIGIHALALSSVLVMAGMVYAGDDHGLLIAAGQYDNHQPAGTRQGGGPASDAKREQVRKKLEAVRIWRMTEELKLDEKTSSQLSSFLSSIEEKRRGFLKTHVETMRDLREALKNGNPDERRLKADLDKIEKNEQNLLDLRNKERAGIKGMLSVEQQARYLIFQQEFRREMRGMMQGARGGNGPGPHQGPPR